MPPYYPFHCWADKRAQPPSTRFTVGLGKEPPPYHPFHCWLRKELICLPITRFTVGRYMPGICLPTTLMGIHPVVYASLYAQVGSLPAVPCPVPLMLVHLADGHATRVSHF